MTGALALGSKHHVGKPKPQVRRPRAHTRGVSEGFPSLPPAGIVRIVTAMILPEQPVTLSVQEVAELNHKLSTMRHDINNSLALVLAGVELMKVKPETAPRMLGTIAEQPSRITALMRQFSGDFEQRLRIKRPEKVHGR